MKKKLLSITMLIILVMLAGCSSAGQYDKDGKKSFENGNYEEASNYFQKAIEANPNRSDYYIHYAMSLIALGKYKDSLAQFDRVYMNKDMSVVKENNKRILRGKGIAYYHMHKYDEAIKEFKRALKIDELSELNVDILKYMGTSLKATGSYQKAIITYTKILSTDEKNAITFADRAFCYQSLGMFEDGLKDYEKAIELDSSNFEYYFGEYNLLMEKGDTADAEAILTKASKIKVKTDEDKYNQAKLYYYEEDYDQALSELELSYSLGFTEAYYYIGEIYRTKKDDAKAIYYYENYISVGKIQNANVYNQIADCLINMEEYKKAIKYLEIGIALNESRTLQILKKNEIIAYEKMGDFDAASIKLKEYTESYPEDKEAVKEAEFINTRLMESVSVKY